MAVLYFLMQFLLWRPLFSGTSEHKKGEEKLLPACVLCHLAKSTQWLRHSTLETTQALHSRARSCCGRWLSGRCHGEADHVCASSGRMRILKSHPARAINGGELGAALHGRDLCLPRCQPPAGEVGVEPYAASIPTRRFADTAEVARVSPLKGGLPCTPSPCRNGPSTA
jgi:hypothetical protein